MNYRLYSFTNMYLSSIQKGIQTAHAVAKLMEQYRHRTLSIDNWVKHHQTIIVLNGQHNANMLQIQKLFSKSENTDVPWAAYYESEESLNVLLTAIVAVLPEEIYGNPKFLRPLTPWEQRLKRYMKNLQLAI